MMTLLVLHVTLQKVLDGNWTLTGAIYRICRKAWKKAALETHPDKTGTSEPFIQITNAYLTLMGTS